MRSIVSFLLGILLILATADPIIDSLVEALHTNEHDLKKRIGCLQHTNSCSDCVEDFGCFFNYAEENRIEAYLNSSKSVYKIENIEPGLCVNPRSFFLTEDIDTTSILDGVVHYEFSSRFKMCWLFCHVGSGDVYFGFVIPFMSIVAVFFATTCCSIFCGCSCFLLICSCAVCEFLSCKCCKKGKEKYKRLTEKKARSREKPEQGEKGSEDEDEMVELEEYGREEDDDSEEEGEEEEYYTEEEDEEYEAEY